VSDALVLDPHARDPQQAPRYGSYGLLPSYGMNPADLADLMNQRRDAAMGEELQISRGESPLDASQPETDQVQSGLSGDPFSIHFEQSSDGERSAASGSYVVMARSRVSVPRIARQLGEQLVTGVVDGEPAEACVIQTTAARLPMVFLPDRFGSKVLMQSGSDYEAGYRIVATVSHGRAKRVKS